MELVSIEKVQEFQANGAVKLENVFDAQWVDLVRKGVDANIESPSQFGESLKVFHFHKIFGILHLIVDYDGLKKIFKF